MTRKQCANLEAASSTIKSSEFVEAKETTVLIRISERGKVQYCGVPWWWLMSEDGKGEGSWVREREREREETSDMRHQQCMHSGIGVWARWNLGWVAWRRDESHEERGVWSAPCLVLPIFRNWHYTKRRLLVTLNLRYMHEVLNVDEIKN